MIKTAPVASIIIPMRNAERFISDALTSLLRERAIPIEVVVIDDKSTDRSVDQVLEFTDSRIRLIRGPGRGIAAAMNAGLGACRGLVIMCCDADDLYPPERIAEQVNWLKCHPEFDGVCGTFSTIDTSGKLIAHMPCGDAPADITPELMSGTLRTHLCTYAMRSSLIQKLGGLREFFETAQDLDFQLRIGEMGRIAFIPHNWYFYRLHAASITHTQSNVMREFFERAAYDLQKQRRAYGLDDLQKGCIPAKPSDDRSLPLSVKHHMQGQLLGRAWEEHRAGKRLQALWTGARALSADPSQTHVWRSILALMLKLNRTAP